MRLPFVAKCNAVIISHSPAIDPNLPTFHSLRLDSPVSEQHYVRSNQHHHQYVPVKSKQQINEETLFESIKSRLGAAMSGADAKALLMLESVAKAQSKTQFLPDERTSMVTDEEVNHILRRSFEYIVALVEFNLITTRFQITHYLFNGFKTELGKTFKNNLINETKWKDLIKVDPSIQQGLQYIEMRIDGVQSSLTEVERLQRTL